MARRLRLSSTEVSMARDHRKLRVFHDAHALTLAIYKQTIGFPRDEWYALRQQMRRAAVSIPSNIVECTPHDPRVRPFLKRVTCISRRVEPTTGSASAGLAFQARRWARLACVEVD
jgi:hypothetical protein